MEEPVANENQAKHLVAVIGAGPAGIYAARQLAASGAQVILLNRDIKPGGLAEYGIYYNKYKMKEGLRKQFRQILEDPQITYLGNVTVGKDSGLSLEDLRQMGFQAVVVTVGAQGTKWLGLPGEELSTTTACRHSAHRPLKSGRRLPWWGWGM
jgi:ferredoxin--NADP+ reductase